jgi:deoxyribonuclease-4
VHCNNSRDEFASGADRHANFPAGTIDPQALLAMVRAAGAPVVCETPEPGLAEDISWLRGQQ